MKSHDFADGGERSATLVLSAADFKVAFVLAPVRAIPRASEQTRRRGATVSFPVPEHVFLFHPLWRIVLLSRSEADVR